VFNLQRLGLLLGALGEGRGELLGEAMADRIHQPARRPLVGPMEEVFEAARAAGALGVCLSGAGPSVLAIVEEGAPSVAEAMRRAYEDRDIACRTHILQADHRGAHLL
ncbi:MAG: homoserine kinase, partial [Nitrospinota bacterium]